MEGNISSLVKKEMGSKPREVMALLMMPVEGLIKEISMPHITTTEMK
jgi:hypothetical protein